MDLKKKIREVPDFPREGINYKDISTLLLDGEAYRQAVQELARQCRYKAADLIVCPKLRGLVIGAPLSYILGTGLAVLQRPVRLPGDALSWQGMALGEDSFYLSREAVKPEMKVLVADELLATGGTAFTAIKMIEELGGEVVGTVFLIELTGLGGRAKLNDYDTISLVQYNF
ncbi:MAG: adenine phosphoribosyltransferase [Pelotomaculum sp.]|uniref:Adenine phosphoribosyltransferase n=1 Tax=Pelotomaculum thermopropionicum (strain DSM 13744 / JCM 10971 / SI) TaxID=370438 RepID=APT_PELTS|nr:RecName: Full=Adenine phosphoribosyltransferase; Short=APRT [Pelotomaculum thermopropionicum SI]NPV72959.1 adenine phosphoribosyltransferase [Pelotomaculum sp.]BAF59225.1 adenine/guanine phosphoribosyltransferases and related PRPP-binding proteins [Pelotomaculum thermopropionicum SI]